MARGLVGILLQGVANADSQLAEYEHRWPEMRPQQDTEYTGAPKWLESASKNGCRLFGRELDGLNGLAAVAFQNDCLARSPEVCRPAFPAVRRLDVSSAVDFENADRYRTWLTRPATAHGQENVWGTGWHSSKNQPMCEGIDQAEEACRDTLTKIGPTSACTHSRVNA